MGTKVRVIRNVLINRLHLRAFQRFGSATKPPEKSYLQHIPEENGRSSRISHFRALAWEVTADHVPDQQSQKPLP